MCKREYKGRSGPQVTGEKTGMWEDEKDVKREYNVYRRKNGVL